MRAMDSGDDTTLDDFLGGRLSVLQPRKGYRAGSDAVFLAAAVPAVAGEHVIEAGLGVGVASLCLACRVPGVLVTGIEQDVYSAELAGRNAAANGLNDALEVVVADVAMPAKEWAGHGLRQGSFAHGFANPPYYEEGRARLPADARRAAAHVRGSGMLERWIRFLVAMVRPRGTVTLILPAVTLPEALGLLAGRAGGAAVLPLFPREGRAAGRVIVQARKGSRAPLRLLPGLVMHEPDGSPTEAAEAVLRGGEKLDLALRTIKDCVD